MASSTPDVLEHTPHAPTLFTEAPPPLLQQRFPTPVNGAARYAQTKVTLPRPLFSDLSGFCQSMDVPLAHAFAAVISTYFCRTTGVDSIVIALPVPGSAETIGSSSVATRLNLDFDGSFMELMRDVASQLQARNVHQRCSEADVSLAFESLNSDGPAGDSEMEAVLRRAGYEPPPLEIVVHDAHSFGDLCLDFNFDTTFLSREEVRLIQPRLIAMLEAALEHHPTCVAQFPIMPQAELALVLHTFNATQRDYPGHELIHELFERQTQARPDAIALVDLHHELTYAQLNRRANQLSQRLLLHGIQPEQRVAICAEPGADMIVALLAVLKAGGACVPIDPDHPAERMAFILKDSAARLLLCPQALTERLPAARYRPALILLDERDARLIDSDPEYDDNLEVGALDLTDEHLACVMYTSGFSGQSKGVMIEHRSVVNLARTLAHTTHAHCPSAANVALNAKPCSDLSIKGIAQLIVGHRLVIVPPSTRADGANFLAFLARHQVHVFDATLSQLDRLLAAGLTESSSYQPVSVLLDGLALDDATWERLRHCQSIRFHTQYGSLECAAAATAGLIRELGENPGMGKPLPNLHVLVLDARGQPMPVGVTGELYLGGIGLGRGYQNDPQLTAQRFVPNPLSADQQTKLYKSGDLGRWRADGSLEYRGRAASRAFDCL